MLNMKNGSTIQVKPFFLKHPKEYFSVFEKETIARRSRVDDQPRSSIALLD